MDDDGGGGHAADDARDREIPAFDIARGERE